MAGIPNDAANAHAQHLLQWKRVPVAATSSAAVGSFSQNKTVTLFHDVNEK
jgi:hypothetical protein